MQTVSEAEAETETETETKLKLKWFISGCASACELVRQNYLEIGRITFHSQNYFSFLRSRDGGTTSYSGICKIWRQKLDQNKVGFAVRVVVWRLGFNFIQCCKNWR